MHELHTFRSMAENFFEVAAGEHLLIDAGKLSDAGTYIPDIMGYNHQGDFFLLI